MSETATVFWYPHASNRAADGTTRGGSDRKFESVETAAMFVMEKLSATERGTSMIMTDRRSIYAMDIAVIYERLKARRPEAKAKR